MAGSPLASDLFVSAGDTGELDYEISDAENSVRDIDEPEVESTGIDEGGRNSKNLDAEEGEIDELEDGEVKDDAPSPIHAPKPGSSPEGRAPGPLPSLPSPTGTMPMPGEIRPEDVGICKFFLRGSCTWGNTCKFLHPRGAGAPPPLPPVSPSYGSQPSPMQNRQYPPRGDMQTRPLTRGHYQGPVRGRGYHHPPAPFPPHPLTPMEKPKPEPPEDAWERGLRQAREMMKRANEKRESEPDFEEKRLLLPLSEEAVERRSRSDSDQDNDLPPSAPRILPTRPRQESPERLSPPIQKGYMEHREQRERYIPPPAESGRYQREGGNYYPSPSQPHYQHRHHQRPPQPVLPPPPDKPNHNYPPPKIYRGTSAGRAPLNPPQNYHQDRYHHGSEVGGQDPHLQNRNRNNAPYYQHGNQQQPYGNQRQNRGGQYYQHRGYPQDQRNMGRRGGGDRGRERGRPLPYDRPSYNEDSGWKDPWERRRGAKDRRGSKRSSSSVSTYSSRSSHSRSLSSRSSSRSSSKSVSRSLSSGSSGSHVKTKKRESAGNESAKTKERVAAKAAMKALGGSNEKPAPTLKKELKKRKRGGDDREPNNIPAKPPPVSVEASSGGQEKEVKEVEEEDRKPIKMTISPAKVKLKSGPSNNPTVSGKGKSSPRVEESVNPVVPSVKASSVGSVDNRSSRDSLDASPPSKKSRDGRKDSRREELLKQLKSVEDAIAKKRTK